MAITARYDLECKQYDIVNVFLNSRIDKGKDNRRVYCQLLLGYKELGFLQGQDDSMILELDKALYRLRELPLL